MSVINFLPASIFKGRPTPDNSFVVPDVFIPHLFDEASVQIWYGSRFSAKSATKARELLGRAASNEYFRGIYSRQYKEDVKTSQYQLFKDIINGSPWLKKQFVPRDSDFIIDNIVTGNKLIPGSFDHPEKIMSIADPTDIWVEEPITTKGEISRSDFISMFGSLRNAHGIPPRFHFTFNPINIESWLYIDFFDKQSIPSNRVLANYDDNPFCPPSAFEFFAWLLETDPDKYLVDAKGKWGYPSRGGEWYNKFSATHYAKPVPFRPELLTDVHTSLDFNTVPYMTMLNFQVEYVGGRLQLRFFKEYCLKSPDNRTDSVCKSLIRDYVGPHRKAVTYHGDRQGENRVEGMGNYRRFDDLRATLKPYLHARSNQVNKAVVVNSTSRDFINDVLAGHLPIDILIDEANCPNLITDLSTTKEASGGIKKVIVTNKETKDRYEKNGHCLSAFTYGVLSVPEVYSLFQQWKKQRGTLAD